MLKTKKISHQNIKNGPYIFNFRTILLSCLGANDYMAANKIKLK